MGKQAQEVKDTYFKNMYNDKMEGQVIRAHAEQEAFENQEKIRQRYLNCKKLQ